jgi:hypothetical protein
LKAVIAYFIGHLCLSISYNKKNELSQTQQIIQRYLPKKIAALLMEYLCIVRPWIVELKRNSNLYYELAMWNDGTKISCQDYYRIFTQVFRKYGKIQLTVLPWRHYCKFIFKLLKYDIEIGKEEDDDDLDIDYQFGHSKKTGMIYGSSNYIDAFSNKDGYKQSVMWHNYFNLNDDNKLPKVKEPVNSKPISKAQITNIQQKPCKLQYDLQMAKKLLDCLKKLHGPQATWKSSYQAKATYEVAMSKRDIILNLPTGGGKTEVILCSSMLKADVSILIVPTIALLLNMKER